MFRTSRRIILNLDPWAASSLLQKAIRRGETALAQQAAAKLHGQRGNGIWRRLMTIAVEDIGIADVQLISDVVRLGQTRRCGRCSAQMLTFSRTSAQDWPQRPRNAPQTTFTVPPRNFLQRCWNASSSRSHIWMTC